MTRVGFTAIGYGWSKAAAVAVLSCLGSSATAQFLPSLAEVTSGDALNVRAGAGANTADIGDLAPGTVIEVLTYSDDREWAQIQWENGNAWVAAQFLKDVARPQLDSGLPVGLSCTGFEPFWRFDLRKDGSVAFQSEKGDITGPITWSAPSRNEGTMRYAFRSDQITGVLQRGLCLKAITGEEAGWTLDFVVTGEAPNLFSGCCAAR